MNVELNFKDIVFLIEALDYRIEYYNDRLKSEELDEDEISDIRNDLFLFNALSDEFKTLKNKS